MIKDKTSIENFLNSIWHSPFESDIDDSKPLLIVIKNGDIKKARFLKNEKLFRCFDNSVAFPNDVIKFLYIEDIIFNEYYDYDYD